MAKAWNKPRNDTPISLKRTARASKQLRPSDFPPDAESPIQNAPISAELIRDLPEDIRGRLLQELSEYTLRVELSSGPLPSGRQLAQLERALPGTGKIVVDTFQQQESHRIRVESRGQQAFIVRDILALVCAFILALSWLLICREAILAGYSVEGIIAMGAELAAIIGVLVYRDQAKRKDREALQDDRGQSQESAAEARRNGTA